MARWLVVGISGVTCGGKSTLANKLYSLFPKSRIVCMDNFFLSPDDSRHVQVPGLTHNNWERLGAIDTEKWKHTIQYILDSNPELVTKDPDVVIPNFEMPDVQLIPSVPIPNLKGGLLILDGFLALNEPWTVQQCNLKFYITLTKDQCWERRKNRHYDPADIPGYFESCVWPEHVKCKAEVVQMSPDVILLDGDKPRNDLLDSMLRHIAKELET